jgi:ribosomal protein S18 acetylase RimI-like enzyme
MPATGAVHIRAADLTTADASDVSRLVRDYLLQTELEKTERGLGSMRDADDLPESYRREVADTALAYSGYLVLLAEIDAVPVGVTVVTPASPAAEIKRLWADPSARNRGVGAALLDAAVAASAGAVQLSVWDWRAPAIRLYESRGFTRVPSWDEREHLVCLRRAA